MSFKTTSQKVEVEGVITDTYGVTGNGITINNLSTEKDKVQSFVDKLNRADSVSMIHMSDLVEDFLAE